MKKLLGYEIPMIEIGRLSTNLGFWVGGLARCTPEVLFPIFSYSPQHTLQIDTMALIPEIFDIFFNTEVDLTICGVFPFIHYTHRVVKFTVFNAYPQYKASYLNDSQIDWLYYNSSTSTGQDSHSVHQTSNMPARQSGWRVCQDMKLYLCAANIRTRICN